MLQKILTRHSTGAVVWAVLLGLLLSQTPVYGIRSGLRLMFEVRDHIHRYYVEPVDSTQVIDAALNGLLGSLPLGENVYISPRDMRLLKDDLPEAMPLQLDNQDQIRLVDEVIRRVSREYVDQVSPDTLSRGLVRGMLTSLDPHSTYLEPDEYDELVERFRGDFEGIGIYFEVRDGKLLVISPIVGSPSYGKLRAGDHIVAIEGISTDGITSEMVMKKLRGPKGSAVRVTVSRQGRREPFEVEIKRDRIEIRSVPYAFMIRPGTGYVRIAHFAETTGTELQRALDELLDRGMEQLLLDLRGNGGGLLTQAVDVADCFLEPEQLIVYTQGRGRHARQEFYAERPPHLNGIPIVVLIDYGSASASEIVAGALQDLDMALLAGQPSFGKGLVQEQFPLRTNGGLLLLTVARYYTPLGRLIQRPYREDDPQAHYRGEELDADAADSLRAAPATFRTGLGREVHGSGGITPDVVLEADAYDDFVYEIFASRALADYSSRLAGTRQDWPREFSVYRDEFQLSQSDLEGFTAYLDSIGVRPDPVLLEPHAELLRNLLKAGIAQVLWGDEQRYQIQIEANNMVQEALALFDQAGELVTQRRARQKRDY